MSYDYIEQRLKPQMKYYSQSCAKLHKKYAMLTTANIIITALSPVFSLSLNDIGVISQYVISILGATSSAITGIIFAGKYKDLWTTQRITYEMLKTELTKYLAGVCQYNISDQHKKLEKFVETCEMLMNGEHESWKETITKESQKES